MSRMSKQAENLEPECALWNRIR